MAGVSAAFSLTFKSSDLDLADHDVQMCDLRNIDLSLQKMQIAK